MACYTFLKGVTRLMKKVLYSVICAVCFLLCGCDKVNEPVSGDALILRESEQEAEEISGEEVSEKGGSLEQTEADACRLAVYVCGAVQAPGVYYLPEGSLRVDALEQAGGFAEGAARDYINLAAHLYDGEQIYFPTAEELSEGVKFEGTAEPDVQAAEQEPLVNINTASKEELMTLPGIGESKADDIIAYRTAHGEFENKEDIKQINGIKDGVYQKISDRITVR